MADESVRIDPYKTAAELPSIAELQDQIRMVKPIAGFVGFLTGRPLRDEVLQFEDKLIHIVELVDGFYGLLGNRNWVLHDSLNTELIEHMIEDGLGPEAAERLLIEHYQNPENLGRYVRKVIYRKEMGGRSAIIERAKEEYLSGRYDSAALRLITVLDGYVNDINTSCRRGLSARNPEEMVGFDCLGGHYLGLSHAVEVFQKSFYKRVDDEVFELYRHGIVHGMVVNFNNDVVASKAWNYLFAVCDWVDSFAKQRIEKEQSQNSLVESLKSIAQAKKARRRLNEWVPHTDYPSRGTETVEPYGATVEFMDSWLKGNVGKMVDILYEPGVNKSEYVDIAKRYVAMGIRGYEVVSVSHNAAAVADVKLILNDLSGNRDASLRWVKKDAEGMPAAEYEEGRWTLCPSWQKL